MTDRDGPEVKAVHVDYLLEPRDLKDIMAKLRGEDLTLEEIALTLLAGGIELEYLGAKYKTNLGPKNLLIVIACQDSLVVDWDDLHRRCVVVIDAVLGDHLRRLEEEKYLVLPTPAEEAPKQGDIPSPPEEPEEEMGVQDPVLDALEWSINKVENTTPVKLLSGGVAPVWSEAHRGPAQRADPGLEPGVHLGLRPGNPNAEKPPGLHKEPRELMVSLRDDHSYPTKGVDIRSLARIVRDDSPKWKDISNWSKVRLIQLMSESNLGVPEDCTVSTVRSEPG